MKTSIKKMKLADLIPTENNPRQIKKDDFERLKKSVQSFPQMLDIREIVVDENNRILGGHQRVRALLANGETEVNVKVVEGLSEEEKREFVIRDNIQNGEWDFDVLANEWDDLPLDDWGIELPIADIEEEIVEDEAPEPPAEPKSKLGEIYQLGEHRLMCGDSTDAEQVDALMGGVLADLCITDPPYNVDYTGGTKDSLKIENDNMGDSEFYEFLLSAFRNANNAMVDGGSFYCWLASREVVNFSNALNDSGLSVKQELVWNKNSLVMGRQDYQWKHEPCLYGWKDGGSHRWFGDRKQTTVIDWDRPVKSDIHPTMKPVGLFAYLIGNSSARGGVVLDLFGGSGTTIIACEQTSRRAYVMEYDPRYVDATIQRWESLTGKKAKLIKEK